MYQAHMVAICAILGTHSHPLTVQAYRSTLLLCHASNSPYLSYNWGTPPLVGGFLMLQVLELGLLGVVDALKLAPLGLLLVVALLHLGSGPAAGTACDNEPGCNIVQICPCLSSSLPRQH